MSITKENVLEALGAIKDAQTGRSLVETGAVRRVAACDDYVNMTIACVPDESMRRSIRSAADAAVRRHAASLGKPVRQIGVEFVEPNAGHGEARVPAQPAGGTKGLAASPPAPPAHQIAGMKVGHIIAVGAGKGGVGKSTVAVNLAVGLARRGFGVGLLDADIYGPSVPTLLGLGSLETQLHAGMLQPFFVHGVKTMTIGKLVDAEKPLIWRGPMAHGAFKQLVEQTQWGDLDYLVIDLPPGTGDVPLTMAQMLSLTGAVIVCTPQKVAQDDAVRAARMFQALNVEVLGVVENMSYFIGDDGKEYDIFGRGGAERMASRLGVPFLGAVPIHMELRENSDAGDPTANFTGNPKLCAAIEAMTRRVEDEVALAALKRSQSGPSLSIT